MRGEASVLAGAPVRGDRGVCCGVSRARATPGATVVGGPAGGGGAKCRVAERWGLLRLRVVGPAQTLGPLWCKRYVCMICE